ncbi:glycosyltransferase [Limnohabitans sp. Rim47]|uniref:MraY family glycosyltransferase n=1 Tax=Limnohabitans sp. Rim47 TaxID=1100721 RepID=UPI000319026A|nr:glycosyltransferase [Limnohabitans sp. Rim47]
MNLLNALHGVFLSPALHAAGWGFASSFSLSVFLVLTKRWHGSFSMDFTDGVQKFHTAPTPRVGGIPVVLGLVVTWFKAPPDVQALLTPILFAGMPAFLFGVAEDITKRVGVMQRLLATMASGLMAWYITDHAITRVDIWGVDWLMQFTVVSVLFTAFVVGGVANSVNIIDGFNGLASTMSALGFVGYALIAWQVGDTTLASVALLLAACVWGFFWVNWPFGKLFLGDGGSYFIGFALAWVAVLLIERNPGVSTFAALMVCVHPITEVLFSIFRRKVRKDHPGMPDSLHFHSLFKRRYVAGWFGQYANGIRNSITGVLIGLMTLTAVVLANFTYASKTVSTLMYVGLCLGYVAIYARMVRHHWCSPIDFLLVKPKDRRVKT